MRYRCPLYAMAFVGNLTRKALLGHDHPTRHQMVLCSKKPSKIPRTKASKAT